MLIAPESFFSPAQYKRYRYACELGEKLAKYCEEGCWLVAGGAVYKKWSVEIRGSFYDNKWDFISFKVGNCFIGIVDVEYTEKNIPQLPTKKAIQAAFNNLGILHPKDIKKF